MISPSLSRTGQAILFGGAAVGLLDAANAVSFWYVSRGLAPHVIFQSIASGWMGRSAFSGGLPTAWLGAGFHFFIACSIAAVYALASRFLPDLIRRPTLYGAAYGVGVYLAMNDIVVPLSNARHGIHTVPWFIADFGGHILLIGIPVAWIVRWTATRQRGDTVAAV